MKTKIKHFLLGLVSLIPEDKNYAKTLNQIKVAMTTFFDGDHEAHILSLGVTGINLQFKEDKILVDITLERPSLLIGTSGESIKKLIEILSKALKKEVKISIIESKLWKIS
jgi:ribosomal protein S3